MMNTQNWPLLFAVAFFTCSAGCGKDEERGRQTDAANNRETAASLPNTQESAAAKGKIAKSDEALLTFGKVIDAVARDKVDWKHPHQVTVHAVEMCRQGKTTDLIKEMGHVQEDVELGKALLTFIKEFGPDLERYKDQEIRVKFHGYFLDKDTSVWYYWLTDNAGRSLEGSPWVSTRRSLRTERCALTGIFLRDPDIKDSPGPMPKGLVTSLE